MLRPTIRKRILGIAIGLIFLMALTSALSTVMTRKIAHQLDEFSGKYVEAYGHLARMNIRSLEQAQRRCAPAGRCLEGVAATTSPETIINFNAPERAKFTGAR